MDRHLLDTHLAATKTCVIQMFDCAWTPDIYTRFDPTRIEKWTDAERTLACKFSIKQDASFARGVHVIRPSKTAREFGEEEFARDRAPKEYEQFIIHDWKHGRIVEWSCAPESLAPYHEEDSSAPLQMSPVFFNPQVLDKYKADREKYRLTDRTITCRNAWSLKTYDVNEAGQVHTYITYLGNLPLSEQRYWKSFNERPKAAISKRAIKSDFEGSWDSEPDGLRDLKSTLLRLSRESVACVNADPKLTHLPRLSPI